MSIYLRAKLGEKRYRRHMQSLAKKSHLAREPRPKLRTFEEIMADPAGRRLHARLLAEFTAKEGTPMRHR